MRDRKCRADRNDESALLRTVPPNLPMRGSIPSPPTDRTKRYLILRVSFLSVSGTGNRLKIKRKKAHLKDLRGARQARVTCPEDSE